VSSDVVDVQGYGSDNVWFEAIAIPREKEDSDRLIHPKRVA
jgi:hypothetical protein